MKGTVLFLKRRSVALITSSLLSKSVERLKNRLNLCGHTAGSVLRGMSHEGKNVCEEHLCGARKRHGPVGQHTGIKLIKRLTETKIAQDGFLGEVIVKCGVEQSFR